MVLVNQPDENTYSLECPKGPNKVAGTKTSKATLLGAINGLAKLDELSRVMQAHGEPTAKIDAFRTKEFNEMTKQTGCVFKSSGKSKAPVVKPEENDSDKNYHNGGGGGNEEHEEL
jgi:hypothetical protein